MTVYRRMTVFFSLFHSYREPKVNCDYCSIDSFALNVDFDGDSNSSIFTSIGVLVHMTRLFAVRETGFQTG